MADASYDAVVIGGGHHGTIIACYLQHAGLQTAIFERQHELGGGACSEEYILPGYVCQPCAHRTRFYAHPAYEDFNLHEKGLEYLYPETGSGMVFDDETCYVGYSAWRVVDQETGRAEYSPEWAERNWREVARFSERDAETVQMLTEKYQKRWRAALNEFFWNPPKPWGEKDAIEMLFDDPVDGIDPAYQVMTVGQIACDLFESEAMRTYVAKTSMSTTTSHPNDVVSVPALLFLYGVCFNFAPSAVVVGGTHNITHSLQRAFSEMGGQFFVQHEVDKVLTENGSARGIRLVDGSVIEAKKLVVADVDINQLVFRFMGEEHVGAKVARKVRNFSYDRANLLWGHIAMHEPPKYKAASFNPDCNTLYSTNWGPKDLNYLMGKHLEEMHSQAIPDKLHLLTITDTHWDKTRAPEGKHVALVEQHTAPARIFSEREWLQKKREIADEIVRQWQWYAPNMTPDNVIGIYVSTPYDTQNRNINMREGSWSVGAGFAAQMGRNRPVPELSGYRMPLKNLYLCSAAAHYGGGIGRSSSYNCFKVIAEDLGLDKVWEKKGRAY